MKTMRNTLLKLIFTVVVFMPGFLVFQTKFAAAQEDACSQNAYESMVSIGPGSYVVYAKLPAGVAATQVSSYTSSFTGDGTQACTPLGSVQLSGESYRKIGDSVTLNGDLTLLKLIPSDTSIVPNAAQPAEVVLVPAGVSLCELELQATCQVTFKDTSMSLLPRKLSTAFDTLKVGILEDFASEQIEKVYYSVDGKLAYTKNELLPFDLRYVQGGEHTLDRVVLFESGLALKDTQAITRGVSADIGYYFLSLFIGQSRLLTIIAYFVVGLIVLLGTRSLLIFVHKRRVWQLTHDATKSAQEAGLYKTAGASTTFYDESPLQFLGRFKLFFIVIGGVSLVAYVVVTFIVAPFTVDGVSMFPTLQDREVKPLLKIQKTAASLNSSDYLPKRGTIVVYKKAESTTFEAVATDSYVVKRVIALPYERVVVREGKIMVYNDEFPNGFEPDEDYKWIEDKTGSEVFSIDITLGAGEIFAVGDNRDESIDSRFYGAVLTKDIVGTVILRE